MTAPVFISYSSKDRAIAETICGALENRGINCWMSSRDIGPGENFQESIIRAIRTASAMVIVFSGNSNNSDEVKKEVALAGQHKLVVVPVRVEDVVPAEAFQYELATRQWIDMFGNWEHAIERLAAQIRTILAGKAAQNGTAQDAAPEPPKPLVAAPIPAAARPKSSGALPLAVAALAVVALSAGGVWWWKNQQLAKDNDAWAAAEQQNSISAYQSYVQAEPDGHHVAEADLRIDGLEWEDAVKLNTVAGYETYKEIEAHGGHLADADAAITALNAAAKAAAEAAKAVQQAPASAPPAPAAAPQASALEEEDFRRALQHHSSAEYRSFLAAHADGVHAAEIRQRLASCQMVRTGAMLGQRTRIRAAGRSGGANQADACRGAQQDGMKRLDAECPNGTVSLLRSLTRSYTPAGGCSVIVVGACAARTSQAEEERCR